MSYFVSGIEWKTVRCYYMAISKKKLIRSRWRSNMEEKEKDLTLLEPQPQKQLSKAERKAIIDQTMKEVTEEYRDVFEKLSKN